MVFVRVGQNQRFQLAHVELLQLGQKPVRAVAVPAVDEEITCLMPYEYSICLSGRQDVNVQIAVIARM